MRKEWRRQKKEREANKKANTATSTEPTQDMAYHHFQSYGQLPAGTIDFY